MYNVVFLINKQYYNTKMSRVRFHSIRALFNNNKINGIYTGPGWDNWVSTISAQANLDNIFKGQECHLVIGYKPLEIQGFADISYTKCIRYNEMYDKQWTLKEITESKANVVICHHYNDYKEYINILKNKKLNHIKCLTWIPHSAEASIFKPNPDIEKKYDVALVGATNVTTMLGEHYPLRARMTRLIGLMPSKYKCEIISHVGGSHSDAYTDKYAIDFANKINSAKIIITDSGAPKSRFGKYIEVPMCGVALAGDVYDDHPKDVELLKSFLIDINMQMSDQEIIKKFIYYLENEKERNILIENGLSYASDFTQEKYADRFIERILEPVKRQRRNWYDDLCDYYKVSPQEADKLGTRSSGRKPSFPGSVTCQPVSGMTMEEIWESKPRHTTAEIFEFYKDLGSWSSFRQCKYHAQAGGNVHQAGELLMKDIKDSYFDEKKDEYHILEYGSGVAPTSIWIADNFPELRDKIFFYIVDVPCEHLTFGEWRLKRRGFNVHKHELKPDILPEYDIKFDAMLFIDCLEHMDAPYNAIKHFLSCCHNKTLFFETWVEHKDKGVGCDLDRDVEITKELINKEFSLIGCNDGFMRRWIKK